MTPAPRRVIFTGAPGAGKTALLEALSAQGYLIVPEAATDVVAAEHAAGVEEPWRDTRFTEKITVLQVRRLQEARARGGIQLFDRSPVCTLALALWLGHEPSAELMQAVDATRGDYERTVFFVRPLGFIAPTAVRRISYEDTLRFERIHEEVYCELGFELFELPAAPLDERVQVTSAALANLFREG